MRRAIVVFTALAAFVVGAGVAVPSVLRARKSGNEASAIGGLGALATSEAIFREGDKEQDGNLDHGLLSELNNTRLVDSVHCLTAEQGDRYFESNMAGVIFYTTGLNLTLDTNSCLLPANGVIPVGKSGGPVGEGGAPQCAPAHPAAEISPGRRLATTNELRPHAPALLARPNGPDLEPLPLEALRISAVLGGTRARVLVDCTFSNPSPAQLEGTFMVSLPEGASPCYLGTFQGEGVRGDLKDLTALVPPASDPVLLLEPGFTPASIWRSGPATVDWGTLRPARVVEEARGKLVYEEVTRRRVDPALMEWSGGNRFSTRIFPIGAGSRKRVVFAFDQAPRDVEGRTLLALPVPSPLPPATRVEVAADGRVYARATLLHGKAETPLEGGVFPRASLVPDAREDGSFVLAATPRSSRVRAGFETGAALPGSVVHARISTIVRGPGERATGDAIFLLDTSLSQRARLAPSCGKLLRSILEKDASIERFRVVGFDVAASELSDGWRPNTAPDRGRVLDAVEHVWLEGATNLEAALARLDATIAPGEHPTIFFLSDGELTWGVCDPAELERAYPRLFGERWIAYQIGDAPLNGPLVERLTRTGGRVVSVPSSGEVEGAALAHRTASIRLQAVRVEGAPASDVIVAGAPRVLFPGQVLEVAFRMPPGADPTKATVVVESGGATQCFALAEAVPGDALASRAWAERTASSLLELNEESADRTVLALSQSFALANRVASFLILETDAEYQIQRLEPAALDVLALREALAKRTSARPSGAPDLAGLSPDARVFLEGVRGRRGKPWTRPVTPPSRGGLAPPSWPGILDPASVHREASRRWAAGHPDEAIRILSSMVEESPRDERALRLTGYALLSWGFFEEAASVFARTRALRPFEPQTWLCEALALEAQGLAGEAAVRYEVVLAGSFDPRHDSYAKRAARRAYPRVLEALGPEGAARAAAIDKDEPTHPAFEATLFWSVDDTDVDLHTIEKDGHEVYYQRPTTESGGCLHWDDTAGLGPEIYTHPTSEPAEAFVHYYGTRSVAGTVPAASLLVVRKQGESPEASCAVLGNKNEQTTIWKASPSREDTLEKGARNPLPRPR